MHVYHFLINHAAQKWYIMHHKNNWYTLKQKGAVLLISSLVLFLHSLIIFRCRKLLCLFYNATLSVYSHVHELPFYIIFYLYKHLVCKINKHIFRTSTVLNYLHLTWSFNQINPKMWTPWLVIYAWTLLQMQHRCTGGLLTSQFLNNFYFHFLMQGRSMSNNWPSQVHNDEFMRNL